MSKEKKISNIAIFICYIKEEDETNGNRREDKVMMNDTMMSKKGKNNRDIMIQW